MITLCFLGFLFQPLITLCRGHGSDGVESAVKQIVYESRTERTVKESTNGVSESVKESVWE